MPVVDQVVAFGYGAILAQTSDPLYDSALINMPAKVLMTVKVDAADVDRIFLGTKKV